MYLRPLTDRARHTFWSATGPTSAARGLISLALHLELHFLSPDSAGLFLGTADTWRSRLPKVRSRETTHAT
jgi:hypothetical protein